MRHMLITGAGTGIGLATALELSRAGHFVYATMLAPADTPELGEIVRREHLPVEIRQMDVRSDASVDSCFGAIHEPIEVLINNAGVLAHGAVEELSIDAFSATIDTNYLGALRCIKAVVPQMREARAGCIINVSSVSGRIAASPLGPYCASKHALEAISEVLAGELKPFDVRVAIVEPGIHDTRLARTVLEASSARYPQCRRWADFFRIALAKQVAPATTAQAIRAVIESGTWQLRHPSGPDAAKFMAWRASLSDEQWVAWNAQDDESWYRQVKAEFGLDLRRAEAVPPA